MRTLVRNLLMLAAVLSVSANALAYDFEANGIYYNILSVQDKTVSVTYKEYSNGTYKSYYSGDVVIPEQAQYNEELYRVTSIGYRAFYGCSSLASVTIPEGVTSIGFEAFSGCSRLASVTIPEGVTYIGDSAFDSCSRLTSVTIPESVTTIGDYAFIGCSSLASVTIPESVTSIGYWAFYNCSSLTSVNISDLSAWSKIDFESSLSNPLIYAHNLYLNGALVTDLVIPKDISEIKPYAFLGGSCITSVTIPEGVTSIGDRAFERCSSLASVTIPESVTTISEFAFWNCSSLASVTIPKSVTSIGGGAFSGCSSLTSVNISDLSAWCMIYFVAGASNPLYNGHNLYLNGVLVTDLVIPEDVSEIKSCAFWGGSCITSVTIPEGVTSIGSSAFSSCSSLASVTIPESVTSIGDRAFSDCISLTSVTIPEGVTYIGDSAFDSCSRLTSVNISDLSAWCRIDFGGYESNPLYYGHNLYLNGALVTDLVIPEDISEIKSYAFSGGSCITSVTIPNSVTTIGSSAFGDCESIEKVISLNQTPPKIDYSIFVFEYSVLSNAILYVPEGSLKAYLMANGWQFVKIREIENGAVSSLEDDAINVTTKDGRIVVEDAQGAVVEVYNAGGQLIYICTDSEIEIPEKGIYVVRVSGRTFKIAVL